jgi:tetratricopeptide (TPR) repeat protein
MTKAVGYVRALAGSGDGDGQGSPEQVAMDAQRGRIWVWCKAQGMDLEDIHADGSGAPGGRPALETALAAAAGGVLVVDRLANLADTVPGLALVAARLLDEGAELVCLADGIDTGADPARVALRVLRAVSDLTGGTVDLAPPAHPHAPEAESAAAPEIGSAPFCFAPEPVSEPVPEPLIDAASEFQADLRAETGTDAPADLPPAWADMPLQDDPGGFPDPDVEADMAPDLASEPAPDASGDADTDAAPEGDLEGAGAGNADADGSGLVHIPLEALEDAVEAASEAVAHLVDEVEAESPAPPARPMATVSPMQDDLATPAEAGRVPDRPLEAGPPPMERRASVPAAEPTLRRVNRRRESDYAAAADKAATLLQKGRLEKAAAVWVQFLKGADGNNAGRAWNHLGDIHVRCGRQVDAVDAWLAASRAFEAAHYNHMAVATLKKVLKVEPGRAEIQLFLAELNARCDRVGDAVEAYLVYARHLKGEERLAEALDVFSSIRILDPINARHRMQLANELLEMGFEAEAAREALYAADLLLERGDMEGASAHLAAWAERLPDEAALAERWERLARGEAEPLVAPTAGVEGGVLLTTGGAGRSRTDAVGWESVDGDAAA